MKYECRGLVMGERRWDSSVLCVLSVRWVYVHFQEHKSLKYRYQCEYFHVVSSSSTLFLPGLKRTWRKNREHRMTAEATR